MRRPGRPAPPIGRAFGLTAFVAFAAVGLWPLLASETPRAWALGAAGLFAIVALAAPRALTAPARAWLAFARVLHAVTGPVVSFAVWALAFVPTGIVARVLGRKLVDLEVRREAPSYFVERTADPRGSASMRDPY